MKKIITIGLILLTIVSNGQTKIKYNQLQSVFGNTTTFLGSTDNKPLNIKINNVQSGIIDTIGNTFWGYRAGRFNTDNASTGFGFEALKTNTNAAGNVAFGYQALKTNTLGGYNTAIGRLCLDVSNGDQNTGLGNGSLHANLLGSYNTALGALSMLNNTGGWYNTAVGNQAMAGCVTGSYNVALGNLSMQTATSGSNVAIGYQSLLGTSGLGNTALGYLALTGATSGSANIGLGYYAGAYNTTLPTRLFINSINRSTLANDSTLSIIYGYQNATKANQRLYLNANTYIPHIVGNTTSPTLALGSGLGTGAGTVVSITRGTDLSGIIGVVTGTAALGTSATLATITFNSPYGAIPNVVLTPANAAAANLITGSNVYVPASSITASVFVVSTNTVALTASSTYSWFYQVIQ
ncbi:hypothetical protein CCP3SC1AL1_510006 [Gammaproteobacteria bacterium]